MSRQSLQPTVTRTVCYAFFARRVCLWVTKSRVWRRAKRPVSLASTGKNTMWIVTVKDLPFAGFQILYTYGSVRCLIEVLCRHFIGQVEQNYGTAWDSRCSRKYSKPAPPACKSRFLPRHQRTRSPVNDALFHSDVLTLVNKTSDVA